MTAQQYKRVKGKIDTLAITWENLLDLGGLRIKHVCVETTDNGSIADTQAQWQYRNAVVTWYLPTAVTQTDEDLELAMIHELVHVMLNPIQEFVPDKMTARNELATENVCRALFSVFHKGL